MSRALYYEKKYSASIVFIYVMSVSVIVLVLQDVSKILVFTIINALMGLILARKKFVILIVLFMIGMIGLVINILLVSNTGQPVLVTPFFVLREQGLINIVRVAGKLLTFMGAGLTLAALVSPREFIDSLERELGFPKEIVFPLALALRMIKLMQSEVEEIKHVRMERRLRTIPILPGDIADYLRPLLSLGLERAQWIGIAAELRAFSQRKVSRRRIKLKCGDMFFLFIFVLQVILGLFLDVIDYLV